MGDGVGLGLLAEPAVELFTRDANVDGEMEKSNAVPSEGVLGESTRGEGEACVELLLLQGMLVSGDLGDLCAGRGENT